MNSDLFLQNLVLDTQKTIDHVKSLESIELSRLGWKQNATSWCILECLEHLNLYGDYYLPKIEDALKKSTSKSDTEFKSGILGAYFSKSMLPKEKLNKMKTFKDKNPLNAALDKTVIEKFIKQQNKLIHLVDQSRHVSLNKVKIQTSISSLIKLNLGDTFQFLVNHTLRHLRQIDTIKHAMNQT